MFPIYFLLPTVNMSKLVLSKPSIILSKLLLDATFALLAVASATDVYAASYSSNGCSGNLTSSKVTLDLCYDTGNGYYAKTTSRFEWVGLSTYSYAMYDDASCSTTNSSASPNPVTGETDIKPILTDATIGGSSIS